MLNKISPSILNMVTTMSLEKNIDCIVYLDKFQNVGNLHVGDNIKYYPFINAIGVNINCKNIYSLAKLKNVKYITHDTKVSTLMNVSNKVLNTPNSEVESAFSVAIIDTGLYPHIDIIGGRNKLIKWVDIINDKKRINNLTPPIYTRFLSIKLNLR